MIDVVLAAILLTLLVPVRIAVAACTAGVAGYAAMTGHFLDDRILGDRHEMVLVNYSNLGLVIVNLIFAIRSYSAHALAEKDAVTVVAHGRTLWPDAVLWLAGFSFGGVVALRASTTTRRTPDEVHAMGLEQLAMLHARMDPILRSLGFTQGTVGERMTALGADPRFKFPANDEGRAQIIAAMQGKIDFIRGKLPQAFRTLVKGNLEIRPLPPAEEAGAHGRGDGTAHDAGHHLATW